MSTACPAGVPSSALNGASSASCCWIWHSVTLPQPPANAATDANMMVNVITSGMTNAGACDRSCTAWLGGRNRSELLANSAIAMRQAVGKTFPGKGVVRL